MPQSEYSAMLHTYSLIYYLRYVKERFQSQYFDMPQSEYSTMLHTYSLIYYLRYVSPEIYNVFK